MRTENSISIYNLPIPRRRFLGENDIWEKDFYEYSWRTESFRPLNDFSYETLYLIFLYEPSPWMREISFVINLAVVAGSLFYAPFMKYRGIWSNIPIFFMGFLYTSIRVIRTETYRKRLRVRCRKFFAAFSFESENKLAVIVQRTMGDDGQLPLFNIFGDTLNFAIHKIELFKKFTWIKFKKKIDQ